MDWSALQRRWTGTSQKYSATSCERVPNALQSLQWWFISGRCAGTLWKACRSLFSHFTSWSWLIDWFIEKTCSLDGGCTFQACQWCSNCVAPKCVPRKSAQDCGRDGQCNSFVASQPITDADKCPENRCVATDCEKCLKKKDSESPQHNCVWSRQILRSGEYPRILFRIIH